MFKKNSYSSICWIDVVAWSAIGLVFIVFIGFSTWVAVRFFSYSEVGYPREVVYTDAVGTVVEVSKNDNSGWKYGYSWSKNTYDMVYVRNVTYLTVIDVDGVIYTSDSMVVYQQAVSVGKGNEARVRLKDVNGSLVLYSISRKD